MGKIKKFGGKLFLKPILLIGGCFVLLVAAFVSFSLASSSTWTQSSWSGESTTTNASVSGWNNYSSKDSSVGASSRVATSGLVSYWAFEDNADDSIGTNNGTATGSSSYAPGLSGQALSFDGDNDYVSVADADSLDLERAFTLSAWLKKNSTGRSEAVLDKGSYRLELGADGRPYFEVSASSSALNSTGNTGYDGGFDVYDLIVYQGKIYAATAWSAGIYRYDGGTTWTHIGGPKGTYVSRSMAVYNGKLYIGAEGPDAVYRYDGGTTWTNVGSFGNGSFGIRTLIVYGQYLYAVYMNNGTVYRYDGGSSWTSVGQPNGGNEVFSSVVYDGKLYVGAYAGSHLYRYDGGTTWTAVGPLPGASEGVDALAVYNGELYVSADGTGDVYKYLGGTNWQNAGSFDASSTEIFSLAVYNGKLYAGGSGSAVLYRYEGGTTWANLGNLGTQGVIYSMARYDGKLFIGTGYLGYVYSYGSGLAAYGSAEIGDDFSQLTASFDGTNAKLYLDSVLIATDSQALVAATNTLPLLIGGVYGSGNGGLANSGEEYFYGQIDETKVYGRALSADEIANNYKAEKYGENRIFLTSTSSSFSRTSTADFSAGTAATATIADGSVYLPYETGGTSTAEYEFPASSTVIYRSVGVTGFGSGLPKEIASSSASFLISVNSDTDTVFTGGSLPNKVGVGDAIVYDSNNDNVLNASDDVVFIHRRNSNTSYVVKNEAGANTATTTTDNDTWAIYRAYNSLADAESSANNFSIKVAYDSWSGGRDLAANHEVWNIACYGDAVDTTAVTIDGWTTGDDNYIRIFTPYLPSDVGVSQRHSGKWANDKYRLEPTDTASTLVVSQSHVRVEGLQAKTSTSGTGSLVAIRIYKSGGNPEGVYIANNILTDGNPAASTRIGLQNEVRGNPSYPNYIFNNLAYGFSGVGLRTTNGDVATSGRAYVFNNTSFNNKLYGFANSSGAPDLKIVIKNNISYDNGSDYCGVAYHASSSHNTCRSSCNGIGSNSINLSAYASSSIFADAAHHDFRLKRGSPLQNFGANLSADPDLPFSTDINNELRPQGPTWDVGADEYSGYYQGSYTSPVFSAVNSDFSTVDWTAAVPASTTLRVSLRTGTTSDMLGASAWSNCFEYWDGYDISNSSCIADSRPYIQYKLSFDSSGNQFSTPVFNDITFNYNHYSSASALVSSPIDLGNQTSYLDAFSWQEDENLPSGTNINLSLRSAADSASLSSAAWQDVSRSSCSKVGSTVSCPSPSSLSDHSGDRFVQYKTSLSSDGLNTPILSSISLNHDVYVPPAEDATAHLPLEALLPPAAPLPAPGNPGGGFQVSIPNVVPGQTPLITGQEITLNFVAGPDTAKIAISEDPSFTYANLEPYSSQKTYFLGSSASGERKLYVKFYTKYGQASKAYAISFMYVSRQNIPAIGSPDLTAETCLLPSEIPFDQNLAKRLSGRFLILPECRGRLLYVNPLDQKKYSLLNFFQTFDVMKYLSLGARHEYIQNTEIFPDRLKGRILLDVERNGEAYYIDPLEKTKTYLGRPHEAFKFAAQKSLGVSNLDIQRIGDGKIK